MSVLRAVTAALALLFFLLHTLWAAQAVDARQHGSALAQVMFALFQGALVIGLVLA